MNEWKTVTLGEVTSFMSKGIAPVYTDERAEGVVVVLNQKCNRNFSISFVESRLHDATVKRVPNDRVLLPGDVLINSTGAGTAGRVAQIWNIPSRTTVDGHMIILRCNNLVDPLYYGYALKMHQAQIESLAEGSTGQTEINRKRLFDEVLISYPTDIALQRKIARTLAALDEKIEANRAINDNLLDLAAALFNQTITENNATLVIKIVSEIADVKGGKRLPKGINLQTTPNNHPYIRVRDLNDACIVQLTPNFEYVDDETQKGISRYIVHTSDVIVSIVGTIGLTALIHESLDNANLTENCVKITNLKEVSPEYLLLFLRSVDGQNAICQGTVGAVQAKLPIKNIQSIPVPIIPEPQKNQLNDQLHTIFLSIAANLSENSHLIQIRDSLLPRLMSGDIDVSEVSI